jgi:heme/copper-type cytochrome/quinol oxidase subunit 2
MWIHHIGEIAMGFFIFLIVLHFSVHFIFKALRMKNTRKKLKQQQEE